MTIWSSRMSVCRWSLMELHSFCSAFAVFRSLVVGGMASLPSQGSHLFGLLLRWDGLSGCLMRLRFANENGLSIACM